MLHELNDRWNGLPTHPFALATPPRFPPRRRQRWVRLPVDGPLRSPWFLGPGVVEAKAERRWPPCLEACAGSRRQRRRPWRRGPCVPGHHPGPHAHLCIDKAGQQALALASKAEVALTGESTSVGVRDSRPDLSRQGRALSEGWAAWATPGRRRCGLDMTGHMEVHVRSGPPNRNHVLTTRGDWICLPWATRARRNSGLLGPAAIVALDGDYFGRLPKVAACMLFAGQPRRPRLSLFPGIRADSCADPRPGTSAHRHIGI